MGARALGNGRAEVFGGHAPRFRKCSTSSIVGIHGFFSVEALKRGKYHGDRRWSCRRPFLGWRDRLVVPTIWARPQFIAVGKI